MSSLSLHENTASSYLLFMHQKAALVRHQICQHLDPGCLGLQNSKNKFLLFLSHSIYGVVLQQSERTGAMVTATRLISPGDALSSKNKTKRRKKKKKTSREQLKEWPEVVAVTGNGQCIPEKQESRAHHKQREGGERERGDRIFIPQTGQEVSTAIYALHTIKM